LQETILQRLRKVGAEVVSVTEPDVDRGGQEPTRDLVRQVLGAIAQYERAVIRGRLMAGKVAKGGYGGGRPAYGTRAEGRQLVPNEAERPIVELVTKLRDQGHSYREIAEALEEAGYRPRSGGSWLPMTVSRIASGNLRALKRALERAESQPAGEGNTRSRKSEARYHR
jgi:DNA invertase Pin-like site-specific DNA recombinase